MLAVHLRQTRLAKALLETGLRITPTFRCFSDDVDGEAAQKWAARFPPRYFDFKAFRKGLTEKKDKMSEAELREVRREYAKDPPEGWTVLEFLKRMKFGDGDEDVANLFESWRDFISMAPRDIMRIPDITLRQRKALDKYITLFNHGLWPRTSVDEYLRRFAGKPLANEGKPWTDEDDRQLVELAGPEQYDVTFGDPWIYLSWELQRTEDDVRDRYIQLAVQPSERSTRHELAITKASRPLNLHRKFRMIPADLYVIPTEENFPLTKKKFQVPAGFQKYRHDDAF